MEGEGYAERLISEALARGELVPEEGLGEPLGDLDDDPDWWVKAFLTREGLPDALTEIEQRRAAILADAISSPDLATARRRLAEANRVARRWNEGAPPRLRVEEVSEIWLLDRRAGRPAG